MKIGVSYFRAKDKATGKQMAILVNEAQYMFILQPWCVVDLNDNCRRHAARSAVGMKGWHRATWKIIVNGNWWQNTRSIIKGLSDKS